MRAALSEGESVGKLPGSRSKSVRVSLPIEYRDDRVSGLRPTRYETHSSHSLEWGCERNAIMSPSLALLLWLTLLIGLLCFDPAKPRATSLALWVPVIWMFIVATRLPSQWLGDSRTFVASQALEEGSSTDRSMFMLLIILSIVVLASRSFQWRAFLTLNRALIAFLFLLL